MADHGATVEPSAIKAAYDAQVQALFKQLATGLGDLGGTAQAEKESLKRFTTGLTHARRARDLALAAVQAETPVALTGSRGKRSK